VITVNENERIRALRKAKGLTLEEFGSKIGVGKTAVSKIERGETRVTIQNRLAICREFNVREEWLRTGEGEMFAETDGSIIESLKEEFHLGAVDVEILKLFLSMDEPERKTLTNFAMRLAASALKDPALRSEYERINGEDIVSTDPPTVPILAPAPPPVEQEPAPSPEEDLAAKVDALERQNKELMARLEAIEKENAILEAAERSSQSRKAGPRLGTGTEMTLEEEADEFAAMAREQFLSEKKQVLQAPSANESVVG